MSDEEQRVWTLVLGIDRQIRWRAANARRLAKAVGLGFLGASDFTSAGRWAAYRYFAAAGDSPIPGKAVVASWYGMLRELQNFAGRRGGPKNLHAWRLARLGPGEPPDLRELPDLRPGPADLAESADESLWAAEVARLHLAGIPPRESAVVWRRFCGETLDDIGRDLRITKERVRQIEMRGLMSLRRQSGPLAELTPELL